MKSRNSMLLVLLMATLLGSMLFGQDHLSKAGKYFFMKDYRNAITEYKLALQTTPTDGRIYYNMGACHEKLGELREAVQAYQTALKHSPGLTDAQNALDRLNQTTEIQADMKASTALQNANSAVLKKDYQTAITEYKKALQASPKNFQALYNIASCYEYLGDYEQAIQNYEKALEQKPESNEAQTAYDRIKEKYSTQLLNTYKSQLDSLVDGKQYGLAQRKASQILKLVPGDRWTLKKMQIVQSQIDAQAETAVEKNETVKNSITTAPDTTDSAALAQKTPSRNEPERQGETENAGFPMYMLYLLTGGMIVIIVLITVMLKRGNGKNNEIEPEKESAPAKPEIKPEAKPLEKPKPLENLANKSVYDILQEHYTGKKTGILRVKGKDSGNHPIEGEVRMLTGNIVDSNSNEKQGIEALYQLLEINPISEITFQNMLVTDSGNIRQATLPLLMKWTLGMKKE